MKPIKTFASCLCLLFCLCLNKGVSQNCAGCTYTVTGSDNQSYTVNIGQTFCVDSLGEFTGTLTLNGGAVCNGGIFKPESLTVLSGTISNHSILIITPTINIGTGFVLQNQETATAAFRENLTVSGGTIVNMGIINAKKNIQFDSGTVSNSAIINCKQLSGTSVNTIVNSSIINTD